MSLLAIIAREGLDGSPLVAIWRLIDWRAIAVEIEPLRQQLDVRRGGPTPWDPASMFAATVLQDWHHLSFFDLSKALRVRLDFQFFAGFEPGLPVPSASSLCRARHRLEESGVRARCKAIIETRLDAVGIKVFPARHALCDIRLARRRATREGGADERGSSVAASLNADVIDQESSP